MKNSKYGSINALVAKAQKIPEEGWTMADGTPWPGNNPRDHPGMIHVFLGHSGGLDTDGNELPRLVYVSCEKRPGFQHHKKADATNALVYVQMIIQLYKCHGWFVGRASETPSLFSSTAAAVSYSLTTCTLSHSVVLFHSVFAATIIHS